MDTKSVGTWKVAGTELGKKRRKRLCNLKARWTGPLYVAQNRRIGLVYSFLTKPHQKNAGGMKSDEMPSRLLLDDDECIQGRTVKEDVNSTMSDFSIIAEIAESLEDSEALRLCRNESDKEKNMVKKLERLFKMGHPATVKTSEVAERIIQSKRPESEIIDENLSDVQLPLPTIQSNVNFALQKVKRVRKIEGMNTATLRVKKNILQRKWEDVELPGSSSEFSPEDLESLVKKFSILPPLRVIIETEACIRLIPSEEWKLGYLVQAGMVLKKTEAKLEAAYGRKPTVSELAKAIGRKESSIQKQYTLFRAAKNKLLMHSLPYCFKMTTDLRDPTATLTSREISSYGIKGLEKAIEKWDPSRKLRLCTYATNWITYEIGMATTYKGYTMKIPMYAGQHKVRFRRTFRELYNELRRKPTMQEISERMNLSLKTCRTLARAFKPSYSLDKPSLHTGTSPVKQLSDLTAKSVFSETLPLPTVLNEVLEKLDPKEKLVVVLRFGLDGNESRPFRECGKAMNCSTTSAQNYCKKALEKLRESSIKMHLWEHVERTEMEEIEGAFGLVCR